MNVLIGNVIPERDAICFGGVHYLVTAVWELDDCFTLNMRDPKGNVIRILVPKTIFVDVVN